MIGQKHNSGDVTAAQIAAGELELLGKRIVVQLQKARDYEAKAREKAGVELRKADDHWNTVTQLLVEAKKKCDGEGFAAFQEKYCPDLKRSRIYKLLAIGSGKETIEDVRAETAGRMRKHRAAKKAAAQAAEKAAAQAAEKAAAEQNLKLSVTVTDNAAEERCAPAWVGAGNDKDTDASTERQKKLLAELAQRTIEKEAESSANTEPEESSAGCPCSICKAGLLSATGWMAATEFSAEDAAGAKVGDADAGVNPAASAKALNNFKAICSWLEMMNGDDLQRAIDYFVDFVEVPAAKLRKLERVPASSFVVGDAAAASPAKSDGDGVDELIAAIARVHELANEPLRWPTQTKKKKADPELKKLPPILATLRECAEPAAVRTDAVKTDAQAQALLKNWKLRTVAEMDAHIKLTQRAGADGHYNNNQTGYEKILKQMRAWRGELKKTEEAMAPKLNGHGHIPAGGLQS